MIPNFFQRIFSPRKPNQPNKEDRTNKKLKIKIEQPPTINNKEEIIKKEEKTSIFLPDEQKSEKNQNEKNKSSFTLLENKYSNLTNENIEEQNAVLANYFCDAKSHQSSSTDEESEESGDFSVSFDMNKKRTLVSTPKHLLGEVKSKIKEDTSSSGISLTEFTKEDSSDYVSKKMFDDFMVNMNSRLDSFSGLLDTGFKILKEDFCELISKSKEEIMKKNEEDKLNLGIKIEEERKMIEKILKEKQENEIKERENEIKEMENEIKIREHEIRQRENEIKFREQEIMNRENEITKKEWKIKKRQKKIKKREKEIKKEDANEDAIEEIIEGVYEDVNDLSFLSESKCELEKEKEEESINKSNLSIKKKDLEEIEDVDIKNIAGLILKGLENEKNKKKMEMEENIKKSAKKNKITKEEEKEKCLEE